MQETIDKLQYDIKEIESLKVTKQQDYEKPTQKTPTISAEVDQIMKTFE